MNNLIAFTKKIIAEVKKDELFSSANDMTYKLFFSLFPFMIFLMSVVGFLNIDAVMLAEQVASALPDALNEPARLFINEIARVKSANILSFSLIVSVYGASAGFRTAMRSINKAYGQKDMRKIVIKIPVSMALVLIFAVIIIVSFALLIFGDNILNLFRDTLSKNIFVLFNILRYIVSLIIVFFSVILINKLALYKNKKNSVKSLVPGTVFTVFLWFIISWLFNIYIENFTNYSALYGSIAAIIILMLWLNIMCIILLLGSEINAALEKPAVTPADAL